MTPEIHGHCEPEFEPVRDAFARGFVDGLEVGASVAVSRGDALVLDLWGGFADAKRTRPWAADTLVFLASTTKILTNLCALMLIDQGKLDPARRVADYWPEFAKHGKERVLVRHVFAHTAGLPGFDPPIAWESAAGWTGAIEALENQRLWWEPGTQQGYHAETFGFLAGELVRRVSGKTPGQFLKTHVAPRIDSDVWIGLPSSEFERVAELVRNDAAVNQEYPAGTPFDRALNCFLPPLWTLPRALSSEFPGGNGVASARGLAKIGAVHANHGVFGGQRLLSEKTLALALTEQSYGVDALTGDSIRRGFGLGLNSAEFPCPSEQTLHWGGRGGSFLIMDLASRTSLAYAPNHWLWEGFHGDRRNIALQQAYMRVLAD